MYVEVVVVMAVCVGVTVAEWVIVGVSSNGLGNGVV